MTGSNPELQPAPDVDDRLHERMEAFGREAQKVGQRFGRDAQAAGHRLANDPTIIHAADTGARIWGLIVLAVGLWFFAQVTLGLPLPVVASRDLWPVALVLIGLFVIVRGMTRRA